MKPTPKQKLERLVEEQELEARAVVDQEKEQERKDLSNFNWPVKNYSTVEELESLVKIYEQKKELDWEIEDVQSGRSAPVYWRLGSGLAAMAPGFGLISAGYLMQNATGLLISLTGATVSVGIMIWYGNRIPQETYKKFAKEKISEGVQRLEEKLEPLNREMAAYETNARPGDIVLMPRKNWFPLNYCLREYFGTPSQDQKEVLAVLEKGPYVSEDDIKALPQKTPLILETREGLVYQYGFLEKVEENSSGINMLVLGQDHNQSTLSFLYCDLQHLREGKIKARLLTFEKTQMEKQGRYRVGAL